MGTGDFTVNAGFAALTLDPNDAKALASPLTPAERRSVVAALAHRGDRSSWLDGGDEGGGADASPAFSPAVAAVVAKAVAGKILTLEEKGALQSAMEGQVVNEQAIMEGYSEELQSALFPLKTIGLSLYEVKNMVNTARNTLKLIALGIVEPEAPVPKPAFKARKPKALLPPSRHSSRQSGEATVKMALDPDYDDRGKVYVTKGDLKEGEHGLMAYHAWDAIFTTEVAEGFARIGSRITTRWASQLVGKSRR